MPFCSPDEAPLLAVFCGELSVLHRIHAEVDVPSRSKIQLRRRSRWSFKEQPCSREASDAIFLINKAYESVEVESGRKLKALV